MSDSPALTALVDQAQTATRHAGEAFTAAATGNGGQLGYTEMSGGRAAMLRWLGERIAAGTTRPCRHVRPGRPEPVVWLAWSPGLLRCEACKQAAAAAMTQADVRCHACDGDGPPTLSTVLIPAVVVGPLLHANGPLTAVFGLCAGCRDTDPPSTVDGAA